MRVNSFRNMEAARTALRVDEMVFLQVNIGESFVHKGEVAMKNYGQAIYGLLDEQNPDLQAMFTELIDNMAKNDALDFSADPAALRVLKPVDDPFAVMDESPEGPFHPGIDPEVDPRLTINKSTLKLWAVTYEWPCHDDCPHNWIHHFQVAIFETSKAEAVRMLLLSDGE